MRQNSMNIILCSVSPKSFIDRYVLPKARRIDLSYTAIYYLCDGSVCIVLRSDGAFVRSDRWRGTVDQEGHDLDLTEVVETAHTDVRIGEGGLASGNLSEHLRRVSAAEHGKLPHRPVPVVIITRERARVKAGALAMTNGVGLVLFGELKARRSANLRHVLNLAGDLLLVKRGKVGKCLEEKIVHGSPHHHHVGVAAVGHERRGLGLVEEGSRLEPGESLRGGDGDGRLRAGGGSLSDDHGSNSAGDSRHFFELIERN